MFQPSRFVGWIPAVVAWVALVAAASVLWAAPALVREVDELQVLGVEPAPQSLDAEVGSSITVTFDRPVEIRSVDERSFWAFGRWSGAVEGTFSSARGRRRITLEPSHPFSAGETVMVVLSRDLRAIDGSPMRSSGYSYQFRVRARRGSMNFEEVERMTTRSDPAVSSRAYGGIGTDLDGDGFLDLAITNEDTNDLRVFLNHGDRSGSFEAQAGLSFALGDTPSPSEPSDFDRDGQADVAIANFGGSISVLLGRGDGTFLPQRQITVGANPRGLAVLDVDGDGDIDIANTNPGRGVSLLLNDGHGVFAPPVFLPRVGPHERALAAADMNEDGLLDLVVGDHDARRIYVLISRGDGTFEHQTTRNSGGQVWMVMTGDVNGDGHEDVSVVSGLSDNGAILLGNGEGGLRGARVYAIDPFPLATDLGDVDGDGDLDWVTSSFNGDWLLFTNRGDGSFDFGQRFAATRAASCALLLDVDNDLDLDLALVDEIADEVIVLRQGRSTPPTDDGCPLAPGHSRRCSECGPCEAGMGDCDGDAECAAGLECASNVGAAYGFRPVIDVCEAADSPPPSTCSLPLGHGRYCSECGPCASGQGDCDSDAECLAGLTCVPNVGAAHGFRPPVDVCL